MMARFTFIQELKNADNENPYLKDVSAEQWDSAIDDSLQEYSSLEGKGRENRLATIIIEPGDLEIALPDDYLYRPGVDDNTLLVLLNGQQKYKTSIPGAYPATNKTGLSPFSSSLGATTDSSNDGFIRGNAEVPISTDDQGNYILVLSAPATTARSCQIRYTGIHQIADPNINTVPKGDRRIVKRLALGYAMEARAKHALQKEQTDLAKVYQSLANQYFSVRDDFDCAFGSLSFS
jgi:hypothetical protein